MDKETRSAPPPGGVGAGVRLEWARVPGRVRRAIEERLGGRVLEARAQIGGFSPGLAAGLRTADGRTVFVKAVGPELNVEAPELFRREVRVSRALPAGLPVPPLLWVLDEGGNGWVAIAFAWIAGRMPNLPWKADELAGVVAALDALADAVTPSPLRPEDGTVRSAADVFAGEIRGFGLLREAPPPALDDWSRRHLDPLCALEAMAPAAATGTTLLHFDVRQDNLLIGGDGTVWVVDWASAAVGAPWIDVVLMAPSVSLQGGPAPEAVLALSRHALAADVDPEAVDAVVASLAGYFTHRALQPPPKGLPTLRAFQAAQGEVTRAWLGRRKRWD